MSYGSNIVYKYDGSFEGFLCCVFESVSAKEVPADIETYDSDQESLFGVKNIDSDIDKAERVLKSISKKMSPHAEYLVKTVFLSCRKQKEMHLLRFILYGYKQGAKVTELTTNKYVDVIVKEANTIGNEAHFSKEFLRFSDFGEFLGARVSPKNNVLPMMVSYFCDRMPSENFVIYDYIHKMAFVHLENGKTEFLYDVDIQFPDPNEEELYYRRLWKHFYKTIAVEGRINPKLRIQMMRKRFWPNMTEFMEDEELKPKTPEFEEKEKRLPMLP